MNKEIKMKRLDLWKAKRKALVAEQRIRGRELQAATRTAMRIEKLIVNLERKIHDYMAKP